MTIPSLVMERLTRILVEGRKDDALKRVAKGINAPEAAKYASEAFKTVILTADPSGNQKYAMWAAAQINQHLMLMQKSYEGERGGHPTGRDERAVSEIKYEADRRVDQIKKRLTQYHKLAERGLIEKDINKFTELGDWDNAVHFAQKELEEREQAKAKETKAKETSNIVDDTKDWMMVRPNDEDGSCYYGQGTTWCISATRSKNYFNQYTEQDGKVFYFIMLKHLHNHDADKKLALVYGSPDDSQLLKPEEVFDVPNDEIGIDGLKEAISANILMRGYTLGQDNPKEFLKIFRSASGRIDDDDRIMNVPGLVANSWQSAVDTTRAVVEMWEEYLEDYETAGGAGGYAIAVPDAAKRVIKGLGMGDPNENDVQEAFQGLVREEYNNILEQASEHVLENPGGATEEMLQEYLDGADLVHIDVYLEDSVTDGYYFSGAAYINMDGMPGILDHPDASDFDDLVMAAANDSNIYPDEVEQETGAGEELEARLYFRPDYDEGSDYDGFKSFVDRMKGADDEWSDFRENLLISMKEAGGYFAKPQAELHLSNYEDLDLQNFEADLEGGKVTMTTFLPIRVYLPGEVLSKLKTGGKDLPAGEYRYIRELFVAIHSGIREGQDKLKDSLINRLHTVTDRALETIAVQQELKLTEDRTGHPIPDYNINIGFKPITISGTELGGGSQEYKWSDRVDVWLDVQLEGNEEPEALKIIETFVKMADHDDFHEKLRLIAEAIVTNMIVREIIPAFKKDWAIRHAPGRGVNRQVAESSFSSYDGYKQMINEWREYKE